jgi:hypothetical protein
LRNFQSKSHSRKLPHSKRLKPLKKLSQF